MLMSEKVLTNNRDGIFLWEKRTFVPPATGLKAPRGQRRDVTRLIPVFIEFLRLKAER
jgi:hypothetical protein